MKRNLSGRLPALIVAMMVLPFLAACGDDDGPTDGNVSALVGTWSALSFTADGEDLIDAGYTISFSFNSGGGYSISVAGDLDQIFCDSGTSCTITGTYSSTGSTITFDPGDVDSVVASYSISGDTMTMTATDAGTTIVAVFEKV